MPATFTKLDAVNEVLTGSGFAPVSSLSASGPAKARTAEQYIDREHRALLAQGWWFNTRREVTLTRDASGQVTVPETIMHADNAGDDYIIIQGKLYSKDGNTFVFASDPVVSTIDYYEFDEVPFEAQNYVAKVALRKFQHARVGNRDALGQHRVDEQDARATLIQKEGENGDANLLLNANLRMHLRAPRIGLEPDY